MRGLDIRITITKILIAVVILVGLCGVYLTGEPVVREMIDNFNRETHLKGEVYKADELEVTIQPVRLFYNRWDKSSGYEGDFVHDGYHFKYGVGMYIPHKALKEVGEIGTTQLGFRLDGAFDKIYFNACTETNWTSGSEVGAWKIICYADGEEIYNTGFQDETYSEKIRLDVEGVQEIVIELEVTRGPDGTSNVILGEFEASKLTDAEGN